MGRVSKGTARISERAAGRPGVRLAGRMPLGENTRLVRVYVEGYDDVAFWRGVFDDFQSEQVAFEISVPPRYDLAKGKKVLLDMLDNSSPRVLLCADSDFDYLFGGTTPQSHRLLGAPYMFHTYAYSTENFLCYAPSLHNVCVKATKNDLRIFDFERFMTEYSRAIYPLFLWYALSAKLGTESFFTLMDFKSSVKLNYLEIENCGEATLAWLSRQVERRMETLSARHPGMEPALKDFAASIEGRGLKPDNVYLFMQGHALMDNVVMVVLHAVCDQLTMIAGNRIFRSSKQGVALRNEQSNYNNSLRNVRDVLLDNENYAECFLYQKLRRDIEAYVAELTAGRG